MAHVKVSRQAEADLEAIVAFYEGINAEYASILEEMILARLEQLEDFPRSGRVVPEIGEASIRELIYRNYRIVYYIDDEDAEVEVLTIFHSSRDFGGLPSRSG